MAKINYNASTEEDVSFSDIPSNTFFTADSFEACGFSDYRQLYYKVSPTQVIDIEEEETYKVKASDTVNGFNSSVEVAITVS